MNKDKKEIDNNIIINVPEKVPKARFGVEIMLKVVFNFILSVFIFLATLALWGFSGAYVYEKLFTPAYMQKTSNLLVFLLIFSLCVFLLMLFWQQYNYRFFGKRKRRVFPAQVPDEKIRVANLYNTSIEDVQKLRRAKLVWLKPQDKSNNVKICHTDKGETAKIGTLNSI